MTRAQAPRRLTLAFAALAALVAFLLTLAADRAEAADYEWPITRIVDGDTLRVDAGADFPGELAALSVRIRGIDTPEKGGRAKCESERARGQAATAFTAEAVAARTQCRVRFGRVDKGIEEEVPVPVADDEPLAFADRTVDCRWQESGDERLSSSQSPIRAFGRRHGIEQAPSGIR